MKNSSTVLNKNQAVNFFWEQKNLEEMTVSEWESLCDGCGQCCVLKLADEQSGGIKYTSVACMLLDSETCLCTAYENRSQLIADCTRLTPSNVKEFDWLPNTCAYRLLALGKKLLPWHPLVCGNPQQVHQQGISVKNKVVSEGDITPAILPEYIIQ